MIMKVKETFESLYKKGDEFKIIKRTTESGLMPICAMRLKDKQIYWFQEDEFEK